MNVLQLQQLRQLSTQLCLGFLVIQQTAWIIPNCWRLAGRLDQKLRHRYLGALQEPCALTVSGPKKYVVAAKLETPPLQHFTCTSCTVAAIHEGNDCDFPNCGMEARNMKIFRSIFLKKKRRNGVFRIKFHFSCWRCLPKDSMTWSLPPCVEKHIKLRAWVAKTSEQSLHKFCQCSKLGWQRTIIFCHS